MKIYLIAGSDLHGSMAAVLAKNGFDIIGHEYTIDAAVVSLERKPLYPDLFVVNGTAQASGASEGVVNRNKSMLIKLKHIRVAAPQSRVLLLLPSENPPELIRGIISLGIYDIRQTSRFDEPTLIDWINRPMSIADFDGIQFGKVPESDPGEISYSAGGTEKQKPGFVKTLENLQAGKGLMSILTERKSAGRPAAVLGVGDSRIEEWIKENFSEQMDVLAYSADNEDLKQKINELSPDIIVLMRQSSLGGIPCADTLAVWAAGRVPAVLFIVGELDGPGKEMADRAAEAGVRHIITCEKGGYISGDELVYVLTSIIREMRGAGEKSAGRPAEAEIPLNGEAKNKINYLLRGAGILGKVMKKPGENGEETARRKAAAKKKPKIKKHGGITFDEEETRESHNANPKNPTDIVPGGILAVVSPWRPNLAGRLAAQAVKILSEVEGSEVAYIGASKDSTGAMWLDVTDEEMIMSDWRVPGSHHPIVQNNVRIYAVDPAKDLGVESQIDLWSLLKQERKTSTYMVIDFAGDISAVRKAAHQGRSVVLVVLPGNDPVEFKISLHWLNNFMEGKQNVVTGLDLRGVPQSIPGGMKPKLVIRNSPADAISMALKKNNSGEFNWN